MLIRAGTPALVLAPMEGVTDAPMRELMSERGGFTHCVSEFLRISQDVPPPRTFREWVPELDHGSRTRSGLPVQVQLLGGDPEKLAIAAARAAALGSPGVDLNFGCPAPTVNRHDGGATLLKHPERIRAIVEAVRKAVPAHLPVSAKLRLGWETREPIHENAEMAAQGGASWITIHGRTKMQGYAPPAYWAEIGEVRARLAGLPVVANGDIWTIEDLRRCREETGCEHFMIGRGALADPALPLYAARELGIAAGVPVPLSNLASDWQPLVARFVQIASAHYDDERYSLARVKMWLRMARARREIPWIEPIKRSQSLSEAFTFLRN
ncbi:MAG: tRNA dihydrouridine synthase [Bdellovibrionota bacterium]